MTRNNDQSCHKWDEIKWLVPIISIISVMIDVYIEFMYGLFKLTLFVIGN